MNQIYFIRACQIGACLCFLTLGAAGAILVEDHLRHGEAPRHTITFDVVIPT